ncbi:peptide/nickel transport system permease protein [Lampropedia hyalina DSM 16112]|uniref:Peptide/nickel transport system permease protein n=1 Tax=Lampropedia hyalina DSM 16112 TaxID=1122156 RepID=A0A1M4WY38_9BURK|nr:peptide/nickel transport system permease protein [Lampropedia hyalina DSM 16112]
MALPVRRGFWQRAWRSRSLVLGALLTLTVLAVAVLAWFWTPHPPAQMDVLRKLQPPGASHWLGTDVYGHDVASQLMVGAQSSILVGLIAVGIGLLGGVTLGLLAATCKGWVDELVMRLADVAFAFPALLLAILFTAVYGSGVGVSMLAIGMAGIPVFARISRASAQVLWTREFVLAARACGKGRWRITRDHILPNLAPLLLVQATVQFAIAILAEAALSYLGLGTQYPTPSWGRMLSEAQSLMFQAPLLAVYPGVAIALSVLGLNLLGDGLRDVLDPRG